MALALLVGSYGLAKAETRCGPDYEPLHVTLNAPVGCVTENLFKRQIDRPSDLNIPRTETSPDTGRRIKSLSEWRQAKPAQPATTENSK
jgi:type IV pilus biogenesis protein CpaD/CtpE